MPKTTFFSTFAPKIGLFSLKTAAKAHTELQYGRTNLTKQFPIKKYAIEKIFSYHTPKCRFFRIEGWYLRRLFSQHPDKPERNGLHRRQRQCLLYLSTKSHLSMSSVEEMREESMEHSFLLIYRSDGLWFNHQFHLSYISANH